MNKCPLCLSVIPTDAEVCLKCEHSIAEDITQTLSIFGVDKSQATTILSDEAMTPEKWAKIKGLFLAAQDVAPNKRESFLKNACAGETEIKDEVENLLSAITGNDSFLEMPAVAEVASMFAEKQATDGAYNTNYDAGTILDEHYQIVRLLGKGGMGEVYLAQDTKLDRNVALKILPANFVNDEERMRRFVQEAKAASALNHPNIITIYEIGEADGTHFIATEYIQGETLNDHLRDKSLNLRSALDIATQIASALVAAHTAGIIHRDIKPDNVMIRNDGIVKVLDFGIAKPTVGNLGSGIDREAATRQKVMTKPGMIIGTPQYMSPEQARGRKVDSRTDIFSLGIVIYEMIASKPPFSGENQFDTISSILKEEPKPLRDYIPEIPIHLEHLVSKALRKDSDQRYQSIKDLYIDLNDIRSAIETDVKLVPDTDRNIAARTFQTNNSIVTQQRFSLIHLLAFLLVFAIAAGGIWWIFAPSTNTTQIASQLKAEEIFNWASQPGEFYSSGTFSPDAKMVAFVSTKSGSKGIWVKRTTSGEAVQITKDEVDYRNPVWSPNGDELAFYSSKGGQAGFWRIPTLGGTPKLIAAIDDGSSRLLFWSKTNQIYYEFKGNIYAIDSVSRQTKQITDLDSDAINRPSLSLSPDEKSIAYIKAEDKIWSLWTSDLKGEAPKKVFSSENEIRNTAWNPDNKRVFFSQLVDGTFQIFEIDIDGNTPQQISSFEQDAFVSDISSDGSKILYGSAKEESDVWKVDLAESKESNVASEIDSELWADVSPDGKTIAYQSIKNLSQGNNLFYGKVLAKNLDTDETPIELADSGFLPKWSPDGQTVAFISISGEQYQIETIRPAGGENKMLTTGINPVSFSVLPYNRLQTSDFSWSPDSKNIAYISNRSGQSNIWLVNADGSNDTQLTENSDSNIYLSCPLWSADGKMIAFTTNTNNSSGAVTYSVQLIDVETKKTGVVNTGNSFIRLIGWSADGSELIVASVENDQTTTLRTEVSLLQVNIETGKTQEISKLKDTYQYNIHLSPDKKRIAFVAHREDKDNIWVIPTTGGEEKQVTGNNDSRLYFSSLAWSPDNNSIFFGKQMRYSLLSMLTDYK